MRKSALKTKLKNALFIMYFKNHSYKHKNISLTLKNNRNTQYLCKNNYFKLHRYNCET